MPITNAFWGFHRGLDLHLVKGQSTPDLLTNHLRFTQANGTVVSAMAYLLDPNNPDDVTIRFSAQITGHQAGDIFHGPGVDIDTQTGNVTAVDPLPPIHLNNFILICQVTNNPDHTVFTLPLRIHIHNAVSKAWLTPSTLTIRPNGTTRPDGTEYRFSVRAQFDDGIVADLTENHGVTYASQPNPGTVGALDGWITLRAGDNPGGTLTVTATLATVMGGAATPPATVTIGDPWPNPSLATVIAEGKWPGKEDPNFAANFLFICDGFGNTDEDRQTFETASNSIVHRFKTNHLTAPFDYLTTSINFWRIFTPSRQRGISVQCEIFTIQHGSDLLAMTMPNAAPPPAAGSWKLEHLLYVVGLPLPRDRPSNTARTNQDITTDWAVLFSPDPTPHLTPALVNGWRQLSNHSLIEERDSELGQVYGELPQVFQDSDNQNINFHFNRMSRTRLNQFLTTLHADPGFDLSAVWAARADGSRPSNFDLVFIISMGPDDRALNADGYITFSVDDTDYLAGITVLPGTNAYVWDPPVIPADISGPRSGRAIHEIAHSFGLGDEYADINRTFTGAANRLDPFGNLQAESDAQLNGNLDGDSIKWTWFRARKGARVSGPVTPLGADRWRVPVEPGEGLQFAIGDPAILRKRIFPIPLGKKPVETVTRNPQDASLSALSVDGRSSDSVTLTGSIAAGLTFGLGDVLYSPVPAPDSVVNPSYRYAELIAKNVKDHFNNHHLPLTAVPCNQAVADGANQIPILDGILNLHISGIDLTSIIGVYHGGAHHPCGIFHPAGSCIMRGGADYDTLQFCAVCRYVLVEIINPFKHFQNDRDYAKIYPLK